MKNFSRLISLTLCLFSIVNVFSQNPLNFGSNIRTADPSAHVWKDGKMYVYTSHDEECQEGFPMKDWHVFSSSDLLNWTDHGAILSVDDLTWADNYAWAPDCAYKNGKYYFCFPAGTGNTDYENPKNHTKWMGIGIAVSDSPTGPFKDAIGGPLYTKPYANDPCLFVDDDDKAYLYAHNIGEGYDFSVIEMSDDMTSVEGDFYNMDMGGHAPTMEGPWVFKRNDIYYFTMPEDYTTLSYYTSKSPKGPWEYQGVFMEASEGINNHHSVVEFKGQWLLFYHRWLDIDSSCGKQRHTCAEYISFNEDGTIKKVKRTEEGIKFPR
jgi:beta-xylosidase